MKEKFFPRDIMPQLLKWIKRREIYAIKGPRQSGKTTLFKMLNQELIKSGVRKDRIVFFNFEDPDVLEKFIKEPKAYVESFLIKKGKYFFLFDEYHYVPNGGKILKLLYDSFENVKFMITGSSSLELAGAMARFLVGRVFFFELLPFSFHEFLVAKNVRLAKIYEKKNKLIKDFLLKGKDFKVGDDIFVSEFKPFFEEYITFGGYPAVIKAEDVETKRMILKGIYDTYISKDVVEFLRISDAFKYRAIVKSLAFLVGNLINYNEIASSCQSYYKEVKHTISLLHETYILNMVSPFYRNPLTELRKIPKIYFYDLGLRNYITNNFRELDERSDKGAVIENQVFLSLLNFQPRYWRTIAKAEVDFLITVNDEKIPVEVKFSSFKEAKISRSLRSFINTYKPKRALVVTRNSWLKAKLGKTQIRFVPACYL